MPTILPLRRDNSFQYGVKVAVSGTKHVLGPNWKLPYDIIQFGPKTALALWYHQTFYDSYSKLPVFQKCYFCLNKKYKTEFKNLGTFYIWLFNHFFHVCSSKLSDNRHFKFIVLSHWITLIKFDLWGLLKKEVPQIIDSSCLKS